MPFSRTLAPGAACLAVIAVLLLPAGATAASTTAQLRVVNTAGTTLADQEQATGDVSVKTITGTDCFGDTSSGATYPVPGPTALGIVKDAADSNAALRPLTVTDSSYSSFGTLGVCAIGGFTFGQFDAQFWYLKVNHAAATLGASAVVLHPGDEVLWYLKPGFNAQQELQLVAPALVQAGKPFTVTVFGFDDGGKRSPVSGAQVTGAELPTGPDGTTQVQLTKSVIVQALRGTDIPSNQEAVCVLTQQNTCGAARHRIVGTREGDKIHGTKLADGVRARGGDDRINVRGGLPDRVNCGAGKDKAVIGLNDVARHCEKVIRKK
jgi:hypothetical protein